MKKFKCTLLLLAGVSLLAGCKTNYSKKGKEVSAEDFMKKFEEVVLKNEESKLNKFAEGEADFDYKVVAKISSVSEEIKRKDGKDFYHFSRKVNGKGKAAYDHDNHIATYKSSSVSKTVEKGIEDNDVDVFKAKANNVYQEVDNHFVFVSKSAKQYSVGAELEDEFNFVGDAIYEQVSYDTYFLEFLFSAEYLVGMSEKDGADVKAYINKDKIFTIIGSTSESKEDSKEDMSFGYQLSISDKKVKFSCFQEKVTEKGNVIKKDSNKLDMTVSFCNTKLKAAKTDKLAEVKPE